MALIRQSRPDFGCGFEEEVLKSFKVFPFCPKRDGVCTREMEKVCSRARDGERVYARVRRCAKERACVLEFSG